MLLAFPLKSGGICSADMAGMMLTQAPECNHLRGNDAGRAAPSQRLPAAPAS
jgi:hypothetical protein